MKSIKKIRVILSIITVSVILLVCLGLLGYFGGKTLRRTYLRMDARKTFAAEDWKKAEKLLKEYLEKDPDSEEDIVRLAQVYRHFNNAEEEMHCWYRACRLNPLKPEYWDKYIECAMKARSFPHLYSALSRKLHSEEELAPRDKMLYLISVFITDHVKDAEIEIFYENMLEEDPEVFQQDDLGRFAEFLITYKQSTSDEHKSFIEQSIQSDDPFVRLESILFYLSDLEVSGEDEDYILEQKESMLKRAVDINWFAMTPHLANFYFSRLRFNSVIEVAEPYLADIENIMLYVIYAESCVYASQSEKLKPLIEHFSNLGPKYRLLVAYFEALHDFTMGLEKNDDLTRHMQEVGNAVQTHLANLINLQVALNNDNVEQVCSSLEALMLKYPFYNLQDRARSAVRHYMGIKIEENPELAENPRIVKMAELILTPDNTDPFLMRITIADQYRRNVLNRQVLQSNLEVFPGDPYLLQVAAEFELFNGKPELCLEYIERFRALKIEKISNVVDFLHMAALELMGRIDEATKEFTELVDNSEMDLDILYRYFRFCVTHERRAELSKMAERLSASNVPELESLAPFFQTEDLLLQGKKEEAFSLLEKAETDQVDFALHAANTFSSNNLLDQALPRYMALLDKHPDKRLVLANIAEVYLAKGMKEEALATAEKAWEINKDDSFSQFVYAKMLEANERYQDAERVLRIPYRTVELQKELRDLWTNIMYHCVQDDLANGLFPRAFERSSHYLILFPEDVTFHDFKDRSEEELKKMPEWGFDLNGILPQSGQTDADLQLILDEEEPESEHEE